MDGSQATHRVAWGVVALSTSCLPYQDKESHHMIHKTSTFRLPSASTGTLWRPSGDAWNEAGREEQL